MPHTSPNVLLLGDATTAEMRPVLAALRERVPADSLRHLINKRRDAASTVQDGWFPDLVVVCQNWPDEFSADDVLGLIRLFPLARIICCFGVWCDSDGRTRAAWPLAVRVPAVAAESRIGCELAWLNHAAPVGAAAPLPLTASRREIFEHDFAVQSVPRNDITCEPADRRLARVTVVSPDSAWRRMLESALGSAGYRAGNLPDDPAPLSAVLWDADPWDRAQSDRLQACRAEHPHATCMVFLGFPRPELFQELHAAGANAVCPKLAPLAELLAQLESLLRQ